MKTRLKQHYNFNKFNQQKLLYFITDFIVKILFIIKISEKLYILLVFEIIKRTFSKLM